MQTFRGDFQARPHGLNGVTSVLTIGNFDGLHLGHQDLLNQVREKSHEISAQVAVLTFDPHPGRFFNTLKVSPLQTEQDRLGRFESLGTDLLFVQNFTQEFAEVSALDFLRHWIVSSLQPQILVLGYDFHFGKGGEGSYELAQSFLRPYGIEVMRGKPLLIGDTAVSSSRVRQALLQGQVDLAEALLGYPYSIQGRVVSGQQLGRQLGFPTANIVDYKTLTPESGVYAGYVQLNQRQYQAVLNLGARPTVSQTQELHCECHLLDFSGELYGTEIKFDFKKRIRPEMRFSGVTQLQEQIKKDVAQVRGLLK